jgi:hypothetical protein
MSRDGFDESTLFARAVLPRLAPILARSLLIAAHSFAMRPIRCWSRSSASA